ncbi:MAG TPA: glycosyltransferase family 39 protein [Chloroflexota bacterium]
MFVAETAGLPELKAGDWNLPLLERLKNGTLQPGDDVRAIQYESWQPPLFYLLAAPVYKLGPGDTPGHTTAAVFRLRLLDIVLGALTLGVAYLVGREVLSPRLATGVPLTLVGVPMFTSVSAAISADPLANLLAGTLVLLLVRRLGQPRDATLRWLLPLGLLLGLGLLTKLALAIFVPLALGVLAVRATRPLRAALLLLVVTGLTSAPWLFHQVTTYGWLDPLATNRHAAVVLDQQRFPGLSPAYLLDFATVTFHSFWAQFGWMGVVAPERLYWVYGLWTAAAAIGLVRAWSSLFCQPAWRLLLLTVAAAVVALIGYNLTFLQFQGRYLFTALVPIGALLVAGWAAWLPRPTRAWGVLLIGVLLVGLNAYALTRVLVPGFAPAG